MNIGVFSDCYLPTKNGVTTAILQLKAGLEQRGHKVVVVTVAMPGADNWDGGIYRVPSLPFRHDIELRIGRVSQGTINTIVAREQLDVIHTHTEFALGWAARRAAKKMQLPLIHTSHTLYEQYRHYLPILPTWIIQRGLRRFLRSCDIVICPSRKMERYIAALIPSISTATIPNGIEKTLFFPALQTPQDIRAAVGIGPGDKVLLFVGRLAKEKRVWELMNALAPLIRKHPQVKLLFVGDGPLRIRLQLRASELGIRQGVVIAGYVEWDVISAWYAVADVFVTASLSEVHPMTLIEAAMSGLPIVARKDEGFTNMVKHGHNGYLADSDEAIAACAFEIIHDETLWQQFAHESLSFAEAFTAQEHTMRIEHVYRRYVDSPAAALIQTPTSEFVAKNFQ